MDTKNIKFDQLPKELYLFGFFDTPHPAILDIERVEAIKLQINRMFSRQILINYNRSSYGLKHIVERELGEYVANGELIAGFILAGFEYVRDGINAHFNVHEDSVKKYLHQQVKINFL